jgi:hypothetical protein
MWSHLLIISLNCWAIGVLSMKILLMSVCSIVFFVVVSHLTLWTI